MEVAQQIAKGGRRDGHRARQDRPVGAVLVDPSGRLIAAARNRNGRCRVRHAELSLVQAWGEARGALPAGSTLWVTLQPCRMCAAWWVAASGGQSDVVFAERDPGPMAQGTALERLGIQRFLDDISSS
jgi:tRNA(Arg) A34 adenosine deaminase TadA